MFLIFQNIEQMLTQTNFPKFQKVQKSSLKLKTTHQIKLCTLRCFKHFSCLSILEKSDVNPLIFKKALANAKNSSNITIKVHSVEFRQFLDKSISLARLVKAKSSIIVNYPSLLVKSVRKAKFISFPGEILKSFSLLRYCQFPETLCIKLKVNEIYEFLRVRLKCSQVYIKLQIYNITEAGRLLMDDIFSEGYKLKGEKLINLDFEETLESLMETRTLAYRDGEEDEDEEEGMKEKISEAELFQKNFMESKVSRKNIVSLHTSLNFWSQFVNSKIIKEFNSYFPNISDLKLELNEERLTSIPALKFPRSIRSLDFNLFLSQSEDGSQISASFFEEIKQLSILTKLNLYIEANNDLLTIYYQFVEMLSHCHNLVGLNFGIDKCSSLSSVFEGGNRNNKTLEAFPLSKLFEALSKLPHLKQVRLSIPLINVFDISSILRINLSRLTGFAICINDQQDLKNEDIRSLAMFITKNTNLRFLEILIKSPDLNEIGIKNFYYQLSKLKSLTELHLYFMTESITQKSVDEFAKIIGNFKNLKKLQLRFNCTINDILPLRRALEQMHLERYVVLAKSISIRG